jgi:hypothetical protein
MLRLELSEGRGKAWAVIWDLSALAAGGGVEERPFHLSAELDPRRWGLARVLSGALADGRLLAIAALRPAGAAGHGEEVIGGASIRGGEPTRLDEVLLSVEYDGEGEVRRVGLELYERPDSLPLRIAGDRRGGAADGDAILELRAEGVAGSGRLTLLRPG